MASADNSSVVWSFFKKLESDRKRRVSCNLCGNEYKSSGNTTNLASHLKSKHMFAYAQLIIKPKNSNKNNEKQVGQNNASGSNFFGSGPSNSPNINPIPSTTASANHQDKDYDGSNDQDILLQNADSARLESGLASGENEANRDSFSSASSSSNLLLMTKKKQQTLSDLFEKAASYGDGGQRHTELTKALIYMIIKDNLPFSSVEKEGLRKFVQVACPRYKLPSRFKVTGLIDQRYSAARAILASVLQETKYVCLSSDIVTVTNSTRSFLVVTVHFFNASDSDASLYSSCLTAQNMTQSHTADYIQKLLESITTEFSIQKSQIINISTDNGSNITAAVRLFLGENKRIPCAAHTINLIIDGVLTKNSDFSNLADRIKSIVTYFKQSVNASDQLRAEQEAEGKKEGQTLMLIQSVSTRWNSCLDMMQRFLKLFSVVAKVLASRSTQKRNVPDMVPSSQLNNLKDLVTLLSPFKTVTEELSGEKYVTASLVIPLTHLLKQEIEQYCPSSEMGMFVKNDLLTGIQERLIPLEQNIFLAKATILDPRFKKMYFSSALAVANTIKELSKDIVAEHRKRGNISPEVLDSPASQSRETTSCYIWSRHEQMLLRNSSNEISGTSIGSMPAELKQYFDQPNISRTSNALKFWVDSRHFIPALSEVALKFLISSATSVASERVASTVSLVVPNSRSCQTAEHIKERVFLKTLDEKYWNM